MAQPVQDKVTLPTLTRADAPIQSWAGALVTILTPLLSSFGRRINGSINADGTLPMAAPLTLMTYEAADLPAAADYEGAIVYVPDGGAGAVFRGSNGSAWVNLG